MFEENILNVELKKMVLTFPFLRYLIVQLGKTGFGVFCFFIVCFLFVFCCRYKLNGTEAYHAIDIKLPLGVLFINKVHCQL